MLSEISAPSDGIHVVSGNSPFLEGIQLLSENSPL